MKTIRLSEATMRALANLAILPFRQTAIRQPDGSYLAPIDDDVRQRLQAIRLPGESDEDTIQRVIHAHKGQPLS